MIPKFKAKIDGGLVFNASDGVKYVNYLDSIKHNDFVSVVVKPWKEKDTRSNQQNRYYHGVLCKIMSNELGYTPEEIHEIFKGKFLSRWEVFDGKKGEVELLITRSTTELKTDEFEKFTSEIRQWASIKFGIYLPEPNEVDY